MAAIECVNFISLSFSRGGLPLGRARCRRKRTNPYENSVVGYGVKAYEARAGYDRHGNSKEALQREALKQQPGGLLWRRPLVAPRWDGLPSQRRSQQLVSIIWRHKPDEVKREGLRFLDGGLADLATQFQTRSLRRVVGPFLVLTMATFMFPMRGSLGLLVSGSMMVLLRGLQKAGICHPGPECKQPYPQHHPRDGANPAGVEKCVHVQPIDPLTPPILC